jgi:hypothetical protein
MTTDGISDALDRLAPTDRFWPDWHDVLGRLDGETRATRRPRKRWLLAAALVLVVASPLTAIGATENWWPFRPHERGEPPTSSPEVVRTGVWDGQEWSLVVYRTESGYCKGVVPATPSQPTEGSFVSGCGGFHETFPNGTGGIGILSGNHGRIPHYVTGPVVESADWVVIHLAGGKVIRTPAFDVPDSLGPIRFYVARVPETTDAGDAVFVKAVGLASNGTVVACIGGGLPC